MLKLWTIDWEPTERPGIQLVSSIILCAVYNYTSHMWELPVEKSQIGVKCHFWKMASENWQHLRNEKWHRTILLNYFNTCTRIYNAFYVIWNDNCALRCHALLFVWYFRSWLTFLWLKCSCAKTSSSICWIVDCNCSTQGQLLYYW